MLQTVWELFPTAPLHTLVYRPAAFENTPFADKTVHSSWLERLPGAERYYRYYLPLMPLAIETLDLSEFDILLSFSYAVAHGVVPRPNQLHLSYIYTPLRYTWRRDDRPRAEIGYGSGIKGWLFQRLMACFRLWGRASAQRVDRFMAVSTCVQQRVWQAYRRPAQVVYPPVDLDRFQAAARREPFYVAISRLVPHKQVRIIVESFARLGLPLLVIGDGPQSGNLAKLAGPHTKLLGWQPDEVVADLLGRARALVHAAEEDFGIALVEAQAAGCPVIAYAGGGASEIIEEGQTGFFFREQTVESLTAAVEKFERGSRPLSTAMLRSSASRFSKARFKQSFYQVVERAWWEAGLPAQKAASPAPALPAPEAANIRHWKQKESSF